MAFSTVEWADLETRVKLRLGGLRLGIGVYPAGDNDRLITEFVALDPGFFEAVAEHLPV